MSEAIVSLVEGAGIILNVSSYAVKALVNHSLGGESELF
jgi:hypothetical protein